MASVDVAVPCYQYGRYLRACVSSVLSQDVESLRVLIIDNASTDDSLEVAQQLAVEDSRVEVIAHRYNLGQHASFNEAVDWTSARYFAILCADDFLAPGALARACSIMEQNPEVVLTYGPTLFLPSSGPIPVISVTERVNWRILPGRELLQQFCRTGRGLPGPMAIVRTCAQKQAGYYRAELEHTDDFELWMRFACLGSAAETDAVQSISRLHPENRSATLFDVNLWNLHCEAAFESFFSREGATAPAAAGLGRIARRRLAERAYWGGIANLLRGHGRLGLELLAFAFTRSPKLLVAPPIAHLFERDDTFSKLVQAMSEGSKRLMDSVFGEHRPANL